MIKSVDKNMIGHLQTLFNNIMESGYFLNSETAVQRCSEKRCSERFHKFTK